MKKTVIILLLLIYSCSVNDSLYLKTDDRLGSREILNYEYSNDYYIHQIRREHFLLNIEIDKPALIDPESVKIDSIYSASKISGEAIVHFTTDDRGRVTDFDFRKRAGLDLDQYITVIIKKLKIKPVSHRGVNGPSEFIARFVFKPYAHF
ncbi:MAG: hypothetical protein JW864_09110 [Spirochaetes bacterium]|nr:hypothetical protein [Spirochaetota bacterium]